MTRAQDPCQDKDLPKPGDVEVTIVKENTKQLPAETVVDDMTRFANSVRLRVTVKRPEQLDRVAVTQEYKIKKYVVDGKEMNKGLDGEELNETYEDLGKVEDQPNRWTRPSDPLTGELFTQKSERQEGALGRRFTDTPADTLSHKGGGAEVETEWTTIIVSKARDGTLCNVLKIVRWKTHVIVGADGKVTKREYTLPDAPPEAGSGKPHQRAQKAPPMEKYLRDMRRNTGSPPGRMVEVGDV